MHYLSSRKLEIFKTMINYNIRNEFSQLLSRTYLHF